MEVLLALLGVATLGEFLGTMLSEFLASLINSILEWADGILIGILEGMFKVEELINISGSTILTDNSINEILHSSTGFAALLSS